MTQLLTPLAAPTEAGAIPLILTTNEAAALLRVSPKTMRNWLSEGSGPESRRLGGRRVYLRDAVFAFAGMDFVA